MKRIKITQTLITATILSLQAVLLFAQPENPNTPSAAVYNYSKYADVAPNMYSGAISEQIPFGSVSAGPLSTGIGLSYYFAGHRPSDISSTAGLGWHLMAGGAITRRIVGMDDFDEFGWLSTGKTIQNESSLSISQINNVADQKLDPQGDIYSIQAGALNIKFAIDHDSICYTVPRSDIKIKLVKGSRPAGPYTYFIVTDTQGNKYYFGEEYNPSTQTYFDNFERTVFDGKSHVSAWYLFKIETHDKEHKLSFSYTDHDYEYYSLQDCETVLWDNGSSTGTIGVPCEMSAEEILIRGKVISSISGLASSATFEYDDKREDLLGNALSLEKVNIKTGSFTKTFTLSQTYFQDNYSVSSYASELNIFFADVIALTKKLKLDAISISGGSETIPTYEFDYYRPNGVTSGSTYTAYAPFSKAIDAYGFANGKSTNNTKDHIIPETKVDFPSTSITFGHSGDIRKSNHNFSISSGLWTMTLPTGSVITYNYESNQFYKDGPTISNVSSISASDLDCNQPNAETDTDNSVNFTADAIQYGSINWNFTSACTNPGQATMILYNGVDTVLHTIYNIDGTQSSSISLASLTLSTSVTYTFKFIASMGHGGADITYPVSGIDTEIGGIRLQSRVVNDDDPTTPNDILRSFVYLDEMGNSSGRRYKVPRFAYGLSPLGFVDNALFSTQSILPYSSYDGAHMGYQMSTIEYNGNGAQVIAYHTDVNILTAPDFPPLPEQQRSLWGQHKMSKSIRESDDAVLQSSQSFINSIEYQQSVPTKMFTTRKIKLKRQGSGSEDFYHYDRKYEINTGTFRPDSTHTTQEGITTAQIYNYNSDNHLSVTNVTQRFSDGAIYDKSIVYTVDHPSGGAQIDSLISRNMKYPVIDTSKINDNTVSSSETDHILWAGDHPRPYFYHRHYYDEFGASESETDTVTYNSKGLITAYSKHGYTISQNFSYDSNSLPKTSGLDDLITTYNYHPNSNLISSVEAVDGTITSYEYDGLMRLKKITDPVGATEEWTYDISKNVQNHQSYILNTKTFPVDTNGLSSLLKLETFAYLDGLGRTQQTVGKAQAFNGKDQISAVTYDKQGRAHKTYQPYASTLSNGLFSPTYSSMSTTATVTTYEPSPLNRPLSVTPPDFGAVSYTYGLNTSSISAADGTPYPIGTVYEKTSIDANNNKSRVYTDPQGRTIMTRRMDSGESIASFVDTKYDYDWRNLLIEVVPPESTITDDELNFIYEYTTKGLTASKKIPSKAAIEYIYDAKNLVIGYQDGYLQSQSQPWYIYKYDPKGRQIASGFHNSQPTNSTTTPSYTLTTTTWGTSDEGKGKVELQTTRLMGTNDFMSSDPNYDDYGRVEWVKSNNPFKLSPNPDITQFFYDGASNIVKTTENVRLGTDQEHERTTTFSTTIDNDGRAIAEFIQLEGQTERQLCAKTYNDKDLILITYQGGDASSYLQKINYNYWTNQSLRHVNGAAVNNTDLFGYRLNYHTATGMSGQTSTIAQYNGNINSIIWAESGQDNIYHSYRYDYLDRLTFDYTQGGENNTSYLYDKRGNFTNVTRKQNNILIDDLAYDYKNDNENQLEDIIDSADESKGYKKANDDVYVYDNNGNLKRDPQKDIDVIYNHLDLPQEITFADGRKINFLYDASGATWKKTLKNPDGSVLQEHTYIGSYETINDSLYSIMHSEGRMVNEGLEDYLKYLYLDHHQRTDGVFEAQQIESAGNIIDETTSYEGSTEIVLSEGFEVADNGIFDATIVQAPTYTESWRYNWSIRDHLGNLRMEYTGASRTTLEILQTQSYYPYGAHINKNLKTNLENRYAYNGIDHVGEFGLDWEMATYRSLDAQIGMWGQVDPYAESFMSMSPYSSMGGNPILYSDPEGGFIHILVGGAIGGIGNLAYQGFTGNISSIGDGFAALGIGAGAGALGAATGGASLVAMGTASSVGGAIAAGAVSGAVGGATAGLVQGTGNAMYFGNQNFGDAFTGAGLQGALYGGLTGAALGGIIGGVSYKAPGTTSSTSSLADEIAVTLDDGTTIYGSPGKMEFPPHSSTAPGGNSNALGGGSVYGNLDDVANAGPMLRGGYSVPQSYNYAGRAHIHPHAFKHLQELGKNRPLEYRRLIGEQYQKSMHSAIDDVMNRSGTLRFNHPYTSGGNRIIFGAPRQVGQLPVVKHFSSY